MYLPKYFEQHDPELIHHIMHRYSFATLITVKDGHPLVSHLPFLFKPTAQGHGVLIGHLARANPQARYLKDTQALVVFQGPHGFISPRWYTPAKDHVPTWNYAVVEARGLATVLTSEDDAYAILQELSATHDPDWLLDLSEKDKRAMLHEIIVFTIDIEALTAKFKLSQNRSPKDFAAVTHALSQGKSELERDLADLMSKISPPR